jgi:hypothetical protein
VLPVRSGWWGRNIFKETLKDHLDRGGMCYEVLTSGVQFFRPERPGVTLGSFEFGIGLDVVLWAIAWGRQLTCIVVLKLDF